MTSEEEQLLRHLSEAAADQRRTVAVAESLTSGQVSARLGAAPAAADWFRGGVVAYGEEVKFDLLGVRPGPVATAECALQMARGVKRVLGADVTAATTGVGGPEPSEGKPAGTVYVAVVDAADAERVLELHLSGEPPEVLEQTCRRVLSELVRALSA